MPKKYFLSIVNSPIRMISRPPNTCGELSMRFLKKCNHNKAHRQAVISNAFFNTPWKHLKYVFIPDLPVICLSNDRDLLFFFPIPIIKLSI